MKARTFVSILCSLFIVLVHAQTVPVTLYLDARHSPYQTVITYAGAELTDVDGNREFETTLDLEPGLFEYAYWVDNSLGNDPDNPRQRNGAGFSLIDVSDPMITYLLPKDGGYMKERRIRADLAYTAANPPLAGSISVSVNGTAVSNPESYYDASKRRLLITNPPSLVDGENTVTVSYETSAGQISRSSDFIYQPILLTRDGRTFRMEQTLVRGRVMETPYPASVFIQCGLAVYEAEVNGEGYFGAGVTLQPGENDVKVAYAPGELNSPVDELSLTADLRHDWWVELSGSLDNTTATVSTGVHGIDAGELSFSWSESSSNPQSLGISGSASQVSFQQPLAEGTYQLELQVSATDGSSYTARKIYLQEAEPHFLGVHERAPWMEEGVIYETEDSYYTWGCYSFAKMKEVLPHMKKVGMNVLQLPPMNVGGYVSTDHFALNTGYGTKEDLISLIDAAHGLGIRVVNDVAFGHTSNNHPFLRSAYYLPGSSAPWDDFYKWEGAPGDSDPVYSEQGRNLVHVNMDSPWAQEYIIKLMEQWIEVYGFDGFRFDCGQEGIVRAPDFMTTLLQRLKNIKPDCWILIEGDDRDHPGISYYDYGDSGYDWKLNSEWGDGGQGLPGVYKGMYSLDELDELINWGISTAAPTKGLLMNYANVDYHPYFHDRYGWEQEKAALSLVFTTYGLPSLFQGEEMGSQTDGGHFDYDDPMDLIPFYSRLIKARKFMLGNYPEVSRLSLDNSSDIYAFTARRDTSMILTVINFSEQAKSVTISLDNAGFQGKTSCYWSEITDLEFRYLLGESSTTVDLDAYESKVFLINTTLGQVFPPLEGIEIVSPTGESSISENGGSLQLELIRDPESSLEEIEWILEGDTHLAGISNGLLSTCGCGDGEITVVARSVSNPAIEDHMDISIDGQTYGQILNPTFDEDLSEWLLWGNDYCNASALWDQGEAHVILDPTSADKCGVSMVISTYLDLKQGSTYRLSFDARSSAENTIYAKIWRSQGEWAQFFWDSFGVGTTMQHYSTEFTREDADSQLGQLILDFEGNGDEFWIDNVSFCEVVEQESEISRVTFRVDLQNEEVASEGIFLSGDWGQENPWNTPLAMTGSGSVYSLSLDIEEGRSVIYKFINGSQWEDFTGDCLTTGEYRNRQYTVTASDEILPVVCFNSCEACETTAEYVDVTFRVDMQNEDVSAAGVQLNGSFCSWNTDEAVAMNASGSVYSATLNLPVGERIQYKFVNGAGSDWDSYELIGGLSCAYGDDANRSVVVPDQDQVLDVVCFASCSTCEPIVDGIETSLTGLRLYPNPANDRFYLEGLPATRVDIRVYDAQGSLLISEQAQGGGLHEVDLSARPGGIYAVSVLDTGRKTILNFRVVKQ